MIIKIYVVWSIAIIVLLILEVISLEKRQYIGNFFWYLRILFIPYNIFFMAKYSYTKISFYTITPVLYFVLVFMGFCLFYIKKKKEPAITQAIVGYFIVLYIVLYLICIYGMICEGNSRAIKDGKKEYKEYSYSIEIVEMEKVPYTNISGSKCYIKSAPSIAYYYDVVTEKGNQTTKILDGTEYYVEKDEDNKYIDNPHIEVYEIVRKYTNLYGKEKEDFVTYEYIICVPENSIYYEENN